MSGGGRDRAKVGEAIAFAILFPLGLAWARVKRIFGRGDG